MSGHQEQSIVRYPARNSSQGETLNAAEQATLARQFHHRTIKTPIVSEGA